MPTITHHAGIHWFIQTIVWLHLLLNLPVPRRKGRHSVPFGARTAPIIGTMETVIGHRIVAAPGTA